MEIPSGYDNQQKHNDSKNICQNLGGALPKITTQGELDMVKKFRQGIDGSPQNIWVGLMTGKDS